MEFLTTTDIEANNTQLELIQNKCVKNRMKNECKMLYTKYHNVLIEGVPDKLSIEIVEIMNTKKRTYKLTIPANFPFHPPKIYINGYTYSDICSVNWSPAAKFHNIIDEINTILKFKRDVINLLLAEKIKIQYNIPYAYFEDYLVLAPN